MSSNQQFDSNSPYKTASGVLPSTLVSRNKSRFSTSSQPNIRGPTTKSTNNLKLAHKLNKHFSKNQRTRDQKGKFACARGSLNGKWVQIGLGNASKEEIGNNTSMGKRSKQNINLKNKNFKLLQKMSQMKGNSSVDDINQDNPKNKFIDYTNGHNLSEYRNVLDHRQIGNGQVQWIMRLRENFQDFSNQEDSNKSRSESTSKLSSYAHPPSCYFKEKQRNKKTISDVKYVGNTLDIMHGLKCAKGGYKELEHLVNIRSSSTDTISRSTAKSLSKSRYNHKRNFQILPICKNSKDYSFYLPHDKKSILLRKSIKVKVRNDPYDLPKYTSKLKDKNVNNSRHLMHSCQHMSSLKWEAGLRDY
ncbi:unnamed protein product [Moneuplotes crassus]|uniref:Uncharacterized protein n=1 Tax=Euplotes crassus TaxID=5936 RepID=A0AAD1UM44_EUPCR|nr:unnamed protein product [Moneuplotes crassus]